MKRIHTPRRRISLSRPSGFTLIEVMIAILVLGVGLLGFALMQTMSVRFAQSSNQRTQAVNLAYDLLDLMRSNRQFAANYTGATFAIGDVTPGSSDCTFPLGAAADIDASIDRWQCQVVVALGGEAAANVSYANGVATVNLNWGDQRWEANATRKTGGFETGRISLETRL
ncbi:MAG: type IV pilus modification protein PilV [Pseudoxanthomonas sp.]